jgi:hypothetical protein
MKRWAEHVARLGEKENAYSIYDDKFEGQRPLGELRLRWADVTNFLKKFVVKV